MWPYTSEQPGSIAPGYEPAVRGGAVDASSAEHR